MSAEPTPAPRRTHWIVWAFAALGGLGAIAVIFLAVTVNGLRQDYQPAKVAGTEPDTVFTLGEKRSLRGTGLLALEIAASRRGAGSSPYSGGTDDRRNILLLDKATGRARKILPDNSRRIGEVSYLPADAEVQDQRNVLEVEGDSSEAPIAYYIVSIHQPGDREISDVLVGRISDGGQAVVMPGVDGIDSVWMLSPSRMAFLVREKLKLFHRIVDTTTLKVVESRQIDID